MTGIGSGFGRKGSRRVGLRAALTLLAVTLAGAAEAAVFGVPTILSADGQVCTGLNTPVAGCPAAAVDPPGYFILTGTAAANNVGDAVHQLRLFIEVTGTAGAATLDIRVFDPGDSGSRDQEAGSQTQFQLLDPCSPFPTCTGAVRRTVTLVDESAVAPLTDNRLVRFSATGAVFQAANAGTTFTALNPGLYEFRVSMTNAGTSTNAFGVDVRDGSQNPLNVFTIGDTGAPATSFIGGAWNLGAPVASITQPMTLFPYVHRGCSLETSNFDGDGATSAALLDALGTISALTVSANNVHSENNVLVEPTAVVNQDATNYGMWTLTNDTTQSNIVDWRVTDYRGWTDNPANAPRDPAGSFRIYLPNAYNPGPGSANATAPAEPILQSGFRVVSGANPPAIGSATTYLVTASLYNPGPGSISSLVLQIPLAAAATLVGSPAATLDGVTTTCAEAGGVPGFLAGSVTAMQCTLTAAVPVGSVASLALQVSYTPAAAGLLPVTGRPSLGLASLTRSGGGGGTATATSARPHWLQTGDTVTIAGSTDATFNGARGPITVTGPNTFTYPQAGAAGAAPGTIIATDTTSTVNSVVALYTPAYSSAAFTRGESAGPVCQMAANVPPPVNLAVTKTDSPDPVQAGQNLTYTITVSNDGASAAPNAAMTDALPAGTTFQSIAISGAGAAGWTCTNPAVGTNGTVSCTAPSLAIGAGGTTTFTLVVQVAAGTPDAATISNTASVASAGQDSDLSNNSATATTTVNRRSDIAVTKTDAPDPTQAGQDITYTITVTNNGPSNSSAITVAEAVPANTTFRAIALPSGWTCTGLPAVGGTGSFTCQVAAGLASGGSARINLQVRVNPGVAAGTVISNTASASVPGGQDTVAANNSATASTTVAAAPTAPTCATGRLGAGGTLAGVVNTYYPGTATATTGATSITLGASTGAATPIAAGDLLLVMQMQDAFINASNDERYGDGTGTAGNTTGNGSGSTSLNNVGLYEYVIALGNVPLGGGTLTIPAPGLSRTYTNAAANGTDGQRRFQVVRVPQYASATLGNTLSAGRWNGTSGGILAFDVAGNLALGTTTVNLTGRGFRAGQGRGVGGPAGTDTAVDYRSPSTLNPHGSKGEGIAGTPQLVYSVAGGTENTGIDGYPNGSSARGAAGNAGGGGTDGNPAANDQNSGGGGGGNGGAGGLGGNSWNSNQPIGGFGGAVFTAAANRLVLGGGGGAGSRNNSAGFVSSGGAGGAIVMIRTSTTSGTGTITTDGDPGVPPDNDGGGGGGAGGSVLFLARGQATLAGLTVNARGGRGSDAWPLQAPNGTPGERHGPGGGGAGGWVIVSGAPTAIVVTGGQNGITTTANDAYGATPGAGGQSLVNLTDAAIPASCPVSDLSITKTDTPDPASIGQPLTYTIVAANSLLTASSVSVTDTLPGTLDFVSAFTTQGTCSYATPTLTCAIGVLASGQSATVTVVVTPNATGTITNTASVTSGETEVTTANNTASAQTTVNPLADLAVTKTDTPDPVQAGGDLTYTIGITNNGPSPAASPALAESVPAGTTFQSITPPAGWTCGTVPAVGGTGAINCAAAADLAPGASVSFTLVVRVNAGTLPGAVLANTATVSTTTPETVLSNNSATAVTSVSSAAALLTRATVRGLRVDRAGRVAFATGTQRGTASFNLYATDDPTSGEGRVLLNGEPVLAPAADSPVPILYEVRTAPITARYLLIEETDRRGRRHVMGPFPVGDARMEASYARLEKRFRVTGRREVRVAGAEHAWQLAPREDLRALGRARNRAGRLAPPSDRVWEGLKVAVSRPGPVSLTRAALEAAGLPPALPLTRVLVSTQGVAVATEVSSPGTPSETLTFKAEGLSTTYTGENVYVLTWAGFPYKMVPLSREEAPAPAGWTRVSKHLVYAASAPPGTDPWLWDVVFADGSTWPDSSWDPEAGTFDLTGLRPGENVAAKVRLRLVGASDHAHVVDAWVNGSSIGSVRFEGRSVALIEGLAGGLESSGNHLSLTYRTEDGSSDGMVLIDHLDLAVTSAPAEGPATVEYMAPFDGALPSFSRVSYLIVSHPAFAAQAERLAALKRAEGQRVVVVDVERAYDRWSAGIVEARAVRALVQEAFRGGSLRYVLLMGDDTYDPQDFSGLGEVSYVPSLYGWDGDSGRVPSENRYADVNGDGSPDVAIGRLPVRSPAEADALVAKIAQQETVLRESAGRHLLVADNQGLGEISFAAEAQALAARLRAGSLVSWARLDDDPAAARAAVAAGIAASPSVVHYFGHGGPEVWADEHLLAVEDVAGLSGSGSVLLTWACQVQDYQYIFGRSVNEEMLMKPEGGALASFGPAGIADAATQAAFYERLYGVLLAKRVSLGEAIRAAREGALAADPAVRSVVESFNLLGDPSVTILGLVPAPTVMP